MEMSDREKIMDNIKKLTSALYRVTDLMSDKEPLKWELRNRAVSVFEKLMSVNSKALFSSQKNLIFDQIKDESVHIMSLLDLVSLGGYVSSLNFDVLKREYEKLNNLVETEKKILTEEVPLFFQESPMAIGQSNMSDKNKGQMSDINLNKKPLPKQTPRVISKTSDKGSERKAKIINLLKNSGAKTIGEIVPIFTGISEKSIQRDLVSLVAEGSLLAEGERRWRRYRTR